MPRRLLWRLKPSQPFQIRVPSSVLLLEVHDAQGRLIPGARVKVLIESQEDASQAASFGQLASPLAPTSAPRASSHEAPAIEPARRAA